MKRIVAILFATVLLLSCVGCAKQTRTELWAMDTYMDLQVWGRDAAQAAAALEALIADMEKTWSATAENSVISRLNRGEAVTLTAEQSQFLEQVELLSGRTGGAFDPKLGALRTLWGFPEGNGQVPDEAAIQQALQQELWDLGGAVKGYAGQQAVALLEKMDVSHALLNLGGNVQTYGQKPDGTPWQIGIQNPAGGDPLGIVAVEGTMAVVTSGDYQRYFELDGVRYHHILDPETGMPAQSDLVSVTVICENGLWADVMSTALFVMGAEKSVDFWSTHPWFEMVLVLQDGTVCTTSGVDFSGCEYGVIR